MRLLHSKGDAWSEDPLEITLREFIGADIPRYMILSHRWREEEILFSHMSNADKSTARNRTGFAKLEESCRIALQMGLEYVWIDTCCIDKSSSAELSEAINSMYAYYAKSEVCFAYLDDVPDYPKDDLPLLNSVWFSRGWTLQELIAPKEIYFYSAGWKKLGSKYSTRKSLIIASGVVEEVLLDPNSLKEFSVAEKMSWAADRVTTRPEDQAYSLMGIFDVNMPPLYGEGREKAFRRLQLEIMNTTLDYTLFAWNDTRTSGDMLATSPYFFRKSKQSHLYLDQWSSKNLGIMKHDYNMTNAGLHMELPVYPVPKEQGLFFAFLQIQDLKEPGSHATTSDESPHFYRTNAIAICVKQIPGGNGSRYYRVPFNNATTFLFKLQNMPSLRPQVMWIGFPYFKLEPSPSPMLSENVRLFVGLGRSEIHLIFLGNVEFWRKPPVASSSLEWHIGFTAEMESSNFEYCAFLIKRKDARKAIFAYGQVNGRLWGFLEEAINWNGGVESRNMNEYYEYPSGTIWRDFQDKISIWGGEEVWLYCAGFQIRVKYQSNQYGLSRKFNHVGQLDFLIELSENLPNV